MAVYPLENKIQKYAWGSTNFIPSLLGAQNPDAEPWAELWMGAHPKAPSMAINPHTGARVSLDALIAGDTVAMLGSKVAARFGDTLPFLFKVLSAAKPLSIQAHPSKKKAERGFEREEFAGIPVDAPERNYRDPNHKPETVVALTPFQGLCGFRPIQDIVEDIKALSPNSWRSLVGRLADSPGKLELSVFFYSIVSMPADRKTLVLNTAKKRCANALADRAAGEARSHVFSWVLRLMDEYPGDIGALAPISMNLFELKPGEALNLAAGQPHAYLSGNAIEIMANSDNVLRGGLTSKHIDIPELISALSFDSASVTPLAPAADPGGFMRYPTIA
ncbi:MAG: mannose-6-phosphate isomerase, class I, partial [Spirochaetales bacterium]|nr:mannose-6-phosphate isomerase, class I [Spirochaetales bacterium]